MSVGAWLACMARLQFPPTDHSHDGSLLQLTEERMAPDLR
jgi:hypothetical protein